MRQSYRFKMHMSHGNWRLDDAVDVDPWLRNHAMAIQRTCGRLFGKTLPQAKIKAHLVVQIEAHKGGSRKVLVATLAVGLLAVGAAIFDDAAIQKLNDKFRDISVAGRQSLYELSKDARGAVNQRETPGSPVEGAAEKWRRTAAESNRYYGGVLFPNPTPGAVKFLETKMTPNGKAKLEQERIANERQKRELFEKEEALRESHGDFSLAPGLTPAQQEAAAVRWAEKNAAQCIIGATPAPF
jgi:hypothetical protein